MSILDRYNKALDSGAEATAKFLNSGTGNEFMNCFLKNLDGAPATMDKYNVAMKNATTQQKAFSASTITAKAAVLAFNVAVSMGLSIALNALMKTISEVSQSEENLKDSAMELGYELLNNTSSVESYKNKIEELKGILSDSSSSFDDVSQARVDLMKIQDELIEKFGTEKGVVEDVTEAICGQTDALDELSRDAYYKAKNEFNKKTNGDKFKDWLSFGSTDDDRIQSNMDKMVSQMRSSSYNLETTGNEVLDNLIAKSYGLNIYDNMYGNGKHFLITGELDEIQEKLYGIQELSQGFDISTGFENDFAEISNDVDSLLESYQNLYDQYVLYEKILTNDPNNQYDEQFTFVKQAKEAYDEALKTGDSDAIQKASDNYAQTLSYAIDLAMSNYDYDVANYFKNMYPEMQQLFGEWQFNLDFEPNTNGIKDKVTDSLKGLEGFSSEDILNFNPNVATEEQVSAYGELNNVAEQYSLTPQQLINLLLHMGLVQSESYHQMVEQFGQDNVNRIAPEDLTFTYQIKNIGDMSFEEFQSEILKLKDESQNNNETDISFTFFTEDQTKSIDDFQSRIKSLGDTLSSLKSGSLDSGALTDLIQEFPELEGQSDNLEQSIQQLIYDSLQELYDTLGESLPKDVKNDLQTIADEASGVAPSLDDASSAIQNSYDVLHEFKDAMDSDSLTDSILSSAGSLSAELNDMVNGFHSGTVSANQLYGALTDHYNTDLQNYWNALIAKKQYSTEFYNAVGLSSSRVIDQFSNNYGVDLENCKSYNSAKLRIEATTLKRISGIWSKYYDAQSMTYKPTLEILRQSAANGNLEAQKEYAEIMKYTTGYTNTMNALNKIVYDGINSDFDKISNTLNDNSGSNSNDKFKSKTAETFNFIETALTRIESAIDRVKSKAEETFRSFKSRSKAYAETISKITDEINLQEQAKQTYIENRDSVGLDEYWATQVRDGSLNIADITDDALKEQIQAYENWNDKVIECTKSIDNLKKDQKELVQESLELLITKYEKLAEKVSNSIESVQNRIDLKEAWGGSASVSDYRSMNKSLAKQIGYIQNQNTELKKLQKTVTKGSEAWYDYQEQIDSNNASVQNLTKSMAENAQASAALSKANADKKAEKYDSRDDLNDAKIDNATTAKSKNSLIDKKISNINGRQKAYDNAVTSSTNRLNASISSINSLKSRKTNTKNKTTNKENKTYNTVLKKVKAQIKTGKRIGANLLNDTTALNDNLALYNACVQYNAYLDAKADNETIAEIYAETAKQEKADLALEKFNNIAAEFDYSTSANEQKKTELNNKISLAEAQGRKVNIAYYNGLISAENGEQQKLIQKRNALQKSLDDAVASGQIEKGSEEWYEMIDAINEVTNAIDDSVESVVEYQNAIRQIRWDTFDDSLETVKRIPGENDFYIDFMSKNKDLIDEDSGNFTEYGNAALTLHNENYKNYLAQAEAYAKEYNDIMVQVARGELSLDDENVIQRLRELQDAQRDAKLSAEDELSSIVNLVKQGYEAQLNALSELIQKYKDLQQSEKDAYEYQKSIAEKTKNISMLQKQLAAYGGNDTEEARAKIQQIKVDLEEAKQDLKETEYEKYLSDTNDMLDEMYGDYEDFIDQRLKDTDSILETINASIGGMSSSIIATLASLNGGITPELEKLLNGSVSSSDYVNGVIASDKAKQQASMREAEAQKAKEEQQKADEERIQAEEAQRQKEYEAEKARRETNEKREELENQLAIEKRNLVELQNKLSDLKNDAQHELDEMNAQRAKKGLKALTSLSNIPGYTKTKQEIEAKIKTAKNNIASIQKQLNDLPQYANGCSYIPYDQLAWTQEKGAEAILRKSDGALLTPLGMGDMVFDNETTHRLLETSKMIPVQLVNGLNHTPVIPALPAIERNVTGGNVSIDLGGINMYGVNDPETFGRQIREEICKNGKTLQCITEGVSSKMTGKGIGSTRLFQ